jgi:hypothetical protein
LFTGRSISSTAVTTERELFLNIEFLQLYPVVAADAMREVRTAVISAVLSLREHWSQRNASCLTKFYQSAYLYLILHFLARIRIAKCFINSSKQLHCEVIIENTTFFHLHSFGERTGVNSGLATRMTLTRMSWVKMGESIIRVWTYL